MVTQASPVPDLNRWEESRRTAQNKVAFLMHLVVYLSVNTFFVFLWALTGGLEVYPWFIFPASAWGIGLASHFAAVYFGPGYVSRLAEREYDRLGSRRSLPP